MAYDAGLAERIRTVVLDRPDVTEKKMFGGIAFMLREHMFVGVNKELLMARIGADNYPATLAQRHVREMDFTGRPLKGYVFVEPAGIEEDDALRYWVDLSAQFVLTLPPKKPK